MIPDGCRAMIKLRLPDITAAETEVSRNGQSILTVFTRINNEMGSSDWREFDALRSRLRSLTGPAAGYNEIRIQTLDPSEDEEKMAGLGELGDPIV